MDSSESVGYCLTYAEQVLSEYEEEQHKKLHTESIDEFSENSSSSDNLELTDSLEKNPGKKRKKKRVNSFSV